MLMRTSHDATGQQPLMFCRPIRTGFGEITVRPLGPADDVLAQAFVTGLSGTSRYLRFFQVLQRLSPAMIERFTRVDHVTMALAGFANVDGTPSMVAEARYAVGADGTSAEIALVVTDQWQHHGLATELMARLERIAVAAGITRLTGECFAVNDGFAVLARSLGFRVRSDPHDHTLLQVEKFIGERAGTGSSRYANGTTIIPGRTRGWEVAAAL